MQISQAWVGLSCINYLHPQPASTPQVSRMVVSNVPQSLSQQVTLI